MISRMIHTSISRSKKIASLSAESQILFMMLIPHFSSHGKMYGGTGFIKDVVCPLIKSLAPAKIDKCLNEISTKTNVKRYSVGGIVYLQSLSWGKHQKLRQDRLGKDLLPSYSRVTPELLPPEVEVEVEVEVEEKKVVSSKSKSKDKFVSKECLEQMTKEYPQYDIKANLKNFMNYAPNRKSPYKDYDAGFRFWMGNDIPKTKKPPEIKWMGRPK